MLNILVCMKVVTDPEAPASTFKIDPEGKRVLPGQGVPPVINPYDENALEAALKIKESQPAKITVISAGKSIPKAVIKKSLAVGADNLIVIEDEALEEADSYTIAFILAAAVKKTGAFDLVLHRQDGGGYQRRPGRHRHGGDTRHRRRDGRSENRG